jgi:cation diffusion facilitator CzcD-associated flavoprotein CzcO
VATRSWLPLAVRVEVVDPDDDTPYWLVGTRQPRELAAALQTHRA